MDAVFVPPSHHEINELMSDLEAFINNDECAVPHLIKIAIVHYQFETIHPFLDGNGRVGRLLITLYLVSKGILEKPLLYLSDFFERNKMIYYDNLSIVREKGNLAQWIRFFLTGVIQMAEKSTRTLKTITDLKSSIEKEVIIRMGKRSKTSLELFHYLFRKPIVTIKETQQLLNLTHKSASDLVNVFVEHGILVETTGYSRNRSFIFDTYVKLFQG